MTEHQKETKDTNEMFSLKIDMQPEDGSENYLEKDYEEFVQWWNDCKSINLDIMDSNWDMDDYFSSLRLLLIDDVDKDDPYHTQLNKIRDYMDEHYESMETIQGILCGTDANGITEPEMNKILLNTHILQKFQLIWEKRLCELITMTYFFEMNHNLKNIDTDYQMDFLKKCNIKLLDIAIRFMGYEFLVIMRKHSGVKNPFSPLKYSEVKFIVNSVRHAINNFSMTGLKMIISNSFERTLHNKKNPDKPYKLTFDKNYIKNWI